MLQIKLAAAFALVLAFVALLVGLLVFGSMQLDYHLERQRQAHVVLQNYLRLSNDAYRLFKQKADTLLIGDALNQPDEVEGRDELDATLDRLRDLTISEIAFVGANEPDEREDLEQIERLERTIERGLAQLEQIASLQRQGEEGRARIEMIRTLETFIDTDFADAIEDAIAEEQREVDRADAASARLTGLLGLGAGIAGVAAAFVVGAAGIWIALAIRTPLLLLLEGTEAVAGGDLGHRVRLDRPAEFARVALSFNRMAAELEQHQAQLLLARNQLERKVQERTGQLEQANRALKRLDEIRRRSFADISHELRTPLTVIRGEAEVTLRNRHASREEQRSALERIVDLSGQLARMVEDMMLLARSEFDSVRLQIGSVELDQVLLSICEDARVLAAEKGVAVHWTVIDRPILVEADPDRLRQLFLILIDNACRYTAEGLIEIRLSDDGERATVVVADTGMGIAEDELGSVFDRFFRGRRAQQQVPRGSGLGLHVARNIVEAHGGRISASSRIGEGTTVKVELPRRHEQEPRYEHLVD